MSSAPSTPPPARPSLGWPIGAAVAATIYAIFLMVVEDQGEIIGLLVGAVVVALLAARFGLLARMQGAVGGRDALAGALILAGTLVISGYFYDDHFSLLLIATVIVYVLATLGLNVQFGYAGVLNFAGAAFFGVGCYTAAVLTRNTELPHLLILAAGGAMSALVGSVLLLPVIRTRGHYAAVVTIAFSLLFKTFLEVNDVLGGPQGLRVGGMELLGWSFNDNLELGDELELSFYLSYVLLGLALLAIAFALVARLDRSWIGLNLDAVRLDETAASCFGLNIVRWKITAFLFGNFLIGVAGAFYAMMLGFIAPTNFTFEASLILVSVVLLGGIGNAWGLILATTIVIIIPEKLQAIQEYRFLIYALMVILMLLFRPEGLLPRPVRRYTIDGRR